jgi:putative transposase
MSSNSSIHHRRSIRLPNFDYTQSGAYFITMVTHKRFCLFGVIENNNIRHNLAGQCIDSILQSLPNHFPIVLNKWVVMPNHVHVMVTIQNEHKPTIDDPIVMELSHPLGTRARSIGAIVQNFKSISTRRIHSAGNNFNESIWQRNYYEHVVRDQNDFDRIIEYIENNPANWDNDELKYK